MVLPIILKAKSVGSIWINKYLNHEGRVGKVVNVFSRTVNIRTSGDELVTVTTLWYRSPIYINCEPLLGFNFQRYVRVGDEIVVKNSKVIIGDYVCIEVGKETPQYTPIALNLSRNDLRFENIEYKHLNQLLKKVWFIILIMDLKDSIYDLMTKNIYLRNQVTKVKGLLRRYVKGSVSKDVVVSELSKLLGAGAGFTPSSDDYLSGLLGFFNIYLIKYGVAEPIYIPLKVLDERTTWVSSRLINYSQHGFFIEPLDEAVTALLKGDLDLLYDSFLKLLSVGHTSGLDTFLGVIDSVMVLQKRW